MSTYIDYPTQQTKPQTFTIETYFQTSVKGGKLIGFGGSATGASSTDDRQLYISSTGAVVFGVSNSGCHTITSPLAGCADGSWHHVAATFSSWRVGYDSISSSWPDAATF